MPIFINEVGNRYGRLTVIERAPAKEHPGGPSRNAHWLCKCDCGNTVVRRGSRLRGGTTESCGCLLTEKKRRISTRHGLTVGGRSNFHPLYNTWSGVKARCHRPNYKKYEDYGGRGIEMYEPWRNNPKVFIDWVEKNLGPRPENGSLDRIDNDGNYEPGNLRWADGRTQANNRREVIYKKPLEGVLDKISDSIEFYTSQSQLAEKSGDLHLKHCYNGVKAGLETAEKWIRDAIEENKG